MILSINCHTPVSYWLSLPIRDLHLWISTNNDINAEREKED